MNIGIVTTWFERGAAYVSKTYMDLMTQLGHKVFIYSRAGWKKPSGKAKVHASHPVPMHAHSH